MATTPASIEAEPNTEVVSFSLSAKVRDAPSVANLQRCLPLCRSRATTWPLIVPKTTASSVTAGVERTREPASKLQTTRPLCRSMARTWPSPLPT